MLKRDQLAVWRRAQAHALLCARAVADRLKHHLAADHQLDRLTQLPCRRGGKRAMRPGKELATKT